MLKKDVSIVVDCRCLLASKLLIVCNVNEKFAVALTCERFCLDG